MVIHLKTVGNPIICNSVMNLEDVMRGETSQTGKNKYHMIPLICGISQSNSQELSAEGSYWVLGEGAREQKGTGQRIQSYTSYAR